ncbi:MAG: CAAD domain-containing protein [Prochloraceae cyanobacterium]|nr:CAAD domain-containing protein [Prochloraceae cyanobacterium]
MESGVPQETKVAEKQQASTIASNISTEPGGQLAPSGNNSQAQVEQALAQIQDSFSAITKLIGDNKNILTVSGLFIVGAIAVYITFALLDAINHIPVLAPLLELVGLGYSIWFVGRYLLKASTRKELMDEFDSIKKDVLGENS